MSQPAIYVVLRDGGFLHAGHNIAGYEVDQVVALGPEVAMRYVEGLVHRPTDRNTHVANAVADELTRAELGTDLSARLAAAGFSRSADRPGERRECKITAGRTRPRGFLGRVLHGRRTS